MEELVPALAGDVEKLTVLLSFFKFLNVRVCSE
jgi:hypothetical protein